MVGFNRLKRGHFHFDYKLITEDAIGYTPEQLTIIYRDEVERIIRRDPANYLWSHRRWKYDWKPEYGEVLK